MKLSRITLALLFSIGTAQAEYQMQINLDGENIRFINWTKASPILGQWQDDGGIYGCSNWSPESSSITITTPFVQTATDCKQNQIRTVQNRELDTVSGSIKNSGEEYTEQRTVTVNQTRESIGSKENWVEVTPTYTNWQNVSEIYGCTNWTPLPSTVTIGSEFTQTSTDCKQNQTRIRQNREQESTTYEVVNVGEPITETQIISRSSNRQSIGTKETWVAATPTYTSWNNVGSVYECQTWSPSPTTVTINQSFTQSSADCKQNQERLKQNREVETTTNRLRDVGEPVMESQVVVASGTRTSTGTMLNWASTTPSYTAWVNSGTISGCTNWNPSPSTVTIGQSFVQTATDCEQTQTRTRQNREIETTTNQIRDVGTPVSESQVVTVSSTRNAIGTKETWVAATPTYTSWVNTNALYGCTNWTPAGSTKTATATFTQTATNCKTDQTRKRQNREQETTTLTYRNTGTAITENQTVSNQSATRSYTVNLGAWTNSGSKTDCTNWSPATSTVNSGTPFNQTATDCKQAQTRTRIEKYVDHKTSATVQVLSTSESKTLTNQSSTRTAIGTKVSKYCTFLDLTTGDGTKIHNWYTSGSNAYFWSYGYQTIPYMWIDVNTGKPIDIMGTGTSPIAGLSKVSNTEFRYTAGSKTWRITRGAYVKTVNTTKYYQICYE